MSILRFACQLRPITSHVRAMSYGLSGRPSNPDPTAGLGAWRSKPKGRAARDTNGRSSRSNKQLPEEPGEDEEGPSVFIRKDRHAGRQRLELDEAKDNDRPTTSFTNRRLNDQQPTRTLFVRGIGWVNTNGSADEVRRLFKGIAEIENVRMSRYYCHVDARTTEEAIHLIEEHMRRPFYYKGSRLFLDYGEPAVEQKAGRTLFVSGFVGGEQHVRDLLGDWKDAIELIRAGKSERSAADVAWVTFRNPGDAAEAMQTLWLSNPNLSIDYARNESVESQLSAGEPYHTLCLVGYTGDKYGLRRILGDFRQAIRDVRIPTEHEKTDRWDFVFVQFKNKDRAIEAREKLAELPHFRARYAGPEDK